MLYAHSLPGSRESKHMCVLRAARRTRAFGREGQSSLRG